MSELDLTVAQMIYSIVLKTFFDHDQDFTQENIFSQSESCFSFLSQDWAKVRQMWTYKATARPANCFQAPIPLTFSRNLRRIVSLPITLSHIQGHFDYTVNFFTVAYLDSGETQRGSRGCSVTANFSYDIHYTLCCNKKKLLPVPLWTNITIFTKFSEIISDTIVALILCCSEVAYKYKRRSVRLCRQIN